MNIIKIEMLSNKALEIGEKLFGYLLDNQMYYDEMPECDKYILRIFKDELPCGFASRESLFSQYSPRDIVQAIIDLNLDVEKPIEFEVINIDNEVSNNSKKLVVLKLMDSEITSKILGVNTCNSSSIDVEKYLDKYDSITVSPKEDDIEIEEDIKAENSVSVNNSMGIQEFKKISLIVKGDVKANPKKTTITRMLKNYEYPKVELVQDMLLNYRIMYEGEYAGDVLDVPNDFKLERVLDVKCESPISFGYNIVIKYRTNDTKETSKVISSIKNEISTQEIYNNTNENTSKNKYFKADTDEILKIVKYLTENNIPENLIDKILSSHEPFEEKYLKRIPHSSDDNFTKWIMSKGDKNLLLRAIIQIEEGFNLRFVGGKGVGKDTLSQTLCWIYQRPRYTQSASIDTDTSILIGDKDLEHKVIGDSVVQTIGFETGLLIEAMEVGGIFELGEGNSCRPGVLMSLHTILDGRKYMDVKGYKLVKAHDRFSFILTMNIDYEGCNDLNQAFRDRFATIKFPPPQSIKEVLKHTCGFANDKDINLCDRIYQNILKLSSELQSEEVITVRGYIRALHMAKYIPITEALECCVIDNVSDDIHVSSRIRHIVENIAG